MDNSTISEVIPYGGEEYRQALVIRQALLRDPLGLKYTEEELAPEKDDTHLAVFEKGRVVAYLFLRPEDKEAVKLRQVVVAEGSQGKGFGTILIRFAESVARQQGYSKVVLYARETAIPFYEKMGYTKEGDPVELVTLPHWFMYRNL